MAEVRRSFSRGFEASGDVSSAGCLKSVDPHPLSPAVPPVICSGSPALLLLSFVLSGTFRSIDFAVDTRQEHGAKETAASGGEEKTGNADREIDRREETESVRETV